MTTLFSYLLLGLSCLTATTSLTLGKIKRIYGGTDMSETNKVPWKVYLKTFKDGDPYRINTGTLISPNVVLTDAGNVDDNWNNRQFSIEATLGENDTKVNESTEQVISVQSIQKNQNIALLHLSRNVTVNENVSPIPRLASAADDTAAEDDSSDCYVVGWGRAKWGGSFRNQPRRFKATVHSNTECRERLYRSKYSIRTVNDVITSDVICASGENAGICDGDGGASLQCLVANTWTLVGAAAWTINDYPCSDAFPDVYNRVSHHLAWIQQNL